MKTCRDSTAPRRGGAIRRYAGRAVTLAWLLLAGAAPGHAQTDAIGRLFYTPEQRALLEQARVRKITQLGEPARAPAASPAAPAVPAPRRFDGVVIRSDGQATRWVDGRPEVGPSSVTGLKPGQTRARGKVYEPYQIVRPQPALPEDEGPSR